MRGLLILVSVMGVLIVVGVATVAVTIVRRMSVTATSASLVLDEPLGTHIGAVSAAGDRFAVLLQGGGPDRVLLLDAQSGKVIGRVGLAR